MPHFEIREVFETEKTGKKKLRYYTTSHEVEGIKEVVAEWLRTKGDVEGLVGVRFRRAKPVRVIKRFEGKVNREVVNVPS